MKKLLSIVLAALMLAFSVSAFAEISLDDAVSSVLAFMGASEDAMPQNTRAEESTEDGVAVYELEFSLDGRNYDAEVARADGTVLSFEVEKSSLPPQGDARMTEAEIRARALAVLSLPETSDTGLRSKKDRDDRRDLYEIFLTEGGVSYELKLDAEDGTLLDYERKSADAVSAATKSEIERSRVSCEDCA